MTFRFFLWPAILLSLDYAFLYASDGFSFPNGIHTCIVITDSKHVSVFLGSFYCQSLSTAKAKELTLALCTDTYVSC